MSSVVMQLIKENTQKKGRVPWNRLTPREGPERDMTCALQSVTVLSGSGKLSLVNKYLCGLPEENFSIEHKAVL